MILADSPAASTTSDRGLPTRRERQLDEHLDLGVQLVGGPRPPSRVCRTGSSRSRSADSATRTRKPARPRRGQAEQAAGAAGVDHADPRAPSPPGPGATTSPSSRSGTISRPAVARIRQFCRAGDPGGSPLVHATRPRTPQRVAIVDRRVEGVHRKQATWPLGRFRAQRTHESRASGRFTGSSAHNGPRRPDRRATGTGQPGTGHNAGDESVHARIRSPVHWRWYESVA
jgi:hypothetical protein